MKIKNNGEAFVVRYGYEDYKIPSGEMEISSDALGVHILKKARAWGFDVVKTENSIKKEIKPIETIKVETVPEVEEQVVEEGVKEEPKKTTTKSKK